MQQFHTFLGFIGYRLGYRFWYHPQIHFDSIWSCEGQINTCVFPTSHPGYALCSSVYCAGTPCKNGRKAHSMTLPAILPNYTSSCVGKLLSVPTGQLVVFARFLYTF